jgi:transposase-like protein
MARMLPAIVTLEQHQQRLRDDPESYRPDRCDHCGKCGLHRHGGYVRNVPRGEGLAFLLGALCIPRFYCPHCRTTCSRLPGCLSPRRQYGWGSQQAVLQGLVCGHSIHEVARWFWPSRRTVRRWWRRLEEQFDVHALHLRSRFAELGRSADWKAFWSLCLERMGLNEAMGWVDLAGIGVP